MRRPWPNALARSRVQVSPSCQRYRQPHAENVNDHPEDHPLERKSSPFAVGGKRYHDVPHQEVDHHPIKGTRNVDVLKQEANPATELYINDGCRKGDEKVQEQTEQCYRVPAIERASAEYAASDPLQNQHRVDAVETTIDNKCGSNIQHSAKSASADYCAKSRMWQNPMSFCSHSGTSRH